MKSLITIICLTLILSSTAGAAKLSKEPLLGYMHDRKGVTFQVYSGGCTSKEDFLINYSTKNGELSLSLNRKIPDNCRAYYPYGIFLHYSYEELGIGKGQQFLILNQMVSSRRGSYL